MYSRINLVLGAFFMLTLSAPGARAIPSADTAPIVINSVGCNSTALAQVPQTRDLFLGRQLLAADGQIAGLGGSNDCSGGDPANAKAGKPYNRFALTLSKFDWATHRLTLLKAILDTSLDPKTHLSRALITGGPMRGARIRSAYDPAIVQHQGVDYIAFECTLESGQPYGVSGTSSCISVFNRERQEADLAKTQVIVSGDQESATRFTAAAVPGLLSYRGRLYLYWSALSIEDGHFKSIAIRGAELSIQTEGLGVKGSRGPIAHALDPGGSVEMWAPNPADPASDVTADLRGVWEAKGSLIASASLGGRGCTAPSDHSPGCFRLGLVRAMEPLAEGGFGHGLHVPEVALPSNAQEYTRPIQDPSGAYWLIGHYLRPDSGLAASRAMPPNEFWQKYKPDSVLVIYPLLDRSLWPKN